MSSRKKFLTTGAAALVILTAAAMTAAAAGVLPTRQADTGVEAPSLEPDSNRVAKLAAGGPPATSTEYAAMLATAGDDPISLGAPTASDLSARDASLVLVDHPSVGRYSVTPTTDGTGLCYSHSFQPGEVAYPEVGCMASFPRDGYSLSVVDSGAEPGLSVVGMIDDEVDAVQIVTADGAVHAATIVGNAYAWSASNRSSETPSTVRVTRAGEVIEESLESMNDPVVEPK